MCACCISLQFDVREWLRSLELEEYSYLLQQEGYESSADITGLKSLTENQLKAMGVTKRGVYMLCVSVCVCLCVCVCMYLLKVQFSLL